MAGLLDDWERLQYLQMAAAQQPAPSLLQEQPAFDESAFQNWIRNTDWFKEFKKEYNEEPNLNAPEYDYRKAWQMGIVPERDPYDNNRYHWASSTKEGEMLKSADHPTAWKEYFMRDFGYNPDELKITKQMYDEMLLDRQKKQGLLD
jgi:hypothetical protein